MTNFRRSTGVDRIYIVSLRLLSAESLTHAELGRIVIGVPFLNSLARDGITLSSAPGIPGTFRRQQPRRY